MIIFFVRDQNRSKHFYQLLLEKKPKLDVPGMTEFSLTSEITLGLMPGDNIAEVLKNRITNPNEIEDIPKCELYLFVEEPENFLQKIEILGGKIISPVSQRAWGDKVGYGMDLDDHLIAFAKKQSN